MRCPQLEIQEIDPRRKHLRKLTGRNRGTVSELNDTCSGAQSPQHKKKTAAQVEGSWLASLPVVGAQHVA